MSANHIVAEAVECNGALTFTTAEMALHMLALLTPAISDCWEDDAVLAVFSRCLGDVANPKEVTTRARETIRVESETRKMILEEDRLELSMTANSSVHPVKATGRSRPKIDFPTLPNFARDLQPLSHLQGMASLDSTLVVVGFSEFGPWGSARTRWQMEAYRQLSPSG
jgi:fatty acid synthase subunit alpha, fungi type